jgi:hypothetical protein
MIIKTGTSQAPVVHLETDGLNQMQRHAGIGAKPNYITSVGRYFGLIQDKV